MAEEKPKIQIDADWKKQAQQEKERLAQEVERGAAGGGAAAGEAAAGGEPAGPEGLPAASFGEIMATLASQVLMFLGDIANPADGRTVVSLPLAKHYIDLLAVLEEKTRGNLAADEKKQLDSFLYETRMRYVQIASGAAGPIGRPPRPKNQ